jgi:hypothetical protein
VNIEIKLFIAILCIVGSPILRKYMEKEREREKKKKKKALNIHN